MKAYLSLIIISLFIFSACASQDSGDVTSDTSNTRTNEQGKTTIDSRLKEIDVVAKMWEFSPSEIVVNKGDRIRLNINSIDVKHGMSIPAFSVSEDLEPGKTVKVEFTADKAGTFEFSCNVFCGDGHSDMKGTLIVKE